VHRTSKTKRDLDVLAPSDVKLADVAGMEDVKARLEVSLLGPIRNPELMRAYKISARGGLLLYGPPGCGKTFLAKAVSGELDANFYPIGISDVLQQYLGNSERAVHEIFEVARRNAPCVLFFDELTRWVCAGPTCAVTPATERSSTRYSPRRIRRPRITRACT
jgi:SpoVK/Ycf46/Vps4 family AAA+-type ATPase